MKFMLSAMLLTMSLGAYAQNEEDLQDDVAAEDFPEVAIPSTPVDKIFFHRVTLGYQGTNVKYTNFGTSPDYNNYFLSGVSLGWMGDLRINKKLPLFLELGANFTYHTGSSKGDSIRFNGEEVRHYRINAFSLTIPVNISYHIRDFAHVDGLTLAPYVGVNARFNIVASRTEKLTTKTATGSYTTSSSASLMKDERNGGVFDAKPHVGKIAQVGAQVGINAYYKRYSFGVAYMHDLTPFAGHVSSRELTSKPTNEGGNLPEIGTGCDMEIRTSHNFAVTVGYIF